MIKELWTGISLENYNKWYPLTGTIDDTPQQYVNTWPNANEWFTTFAIRAQNDINAYINFILYKFPFDSFKDKLLQETLRDMVYVMVEHWVFNRTPIEFNVDANIQFNNGTQFSASSIPTINVWDLAPSRMKILSQLTQLKEILMNYDEQEIAVDKIDLETFYTRNQVDELIDNEKEQRISGDKDNHDFTLTKQIKLYDDVISKNEHEVFRGAVTKLVNKSYVATEYDPETETMVLNWPSEIGTLPPEALQNNPQENDFTHAATADFSAKQQKRITSNENNIKLANKEIESIKNNWFNIETSPLWTKTNNHNINQDKWYVVSWYFSYINNGNYNNRINKLTKTLIYPPIQSSKPQEFIIIDKLIINENIIVSLFYNYLGFKFFIDVDDKSGATNHQYTSVIIEVYEYQGFGTPTEFIAETNNDDNYYTKQETNELLDKKQNINDENLETTNKTISGGINENKSNIDKKQDKLTLIKEDTTYKVLQYNELGNGQFTGELDIPPTKFVKKFIDEKINKLNFITWKSVGTISNENENIEYNFKLNTLYRVAYSWAYLKSNGSSKYLIFMWRGAPAILDSTFQAENNQKVVTNYVDLGVTSAMIYLKKYNYQTGFLLSLEEAENTNTKNYSEQILPITPPIPPTPCPCPKWKEVALSTDGFTIKYDLKENTKYRIYYNCSKIPVTILESGVYKVIELFNGLLPTCTCGGKNELKWIQQNISNWKTMSCIYSKFETKQMY
ncbi:hypothetical protein [Spiroplasma endosymbiont of Nebria brevicollis]|uniref:hypothetical protein n=1 Tax=Spiroplasma endosymbiont of Nebria brevicollis TaxID=3066284 RepID=UPI00313EC0AC